MLEYLSIIFSAILVNNIVFAQFLGICPFIGVSKNLESAFGMSMAVTFVMAVATAVAPAALCAFAARACLHTDYRFYTGYSSAGADA
jgi:Na+-translocating ferredoxin:NAD+ oxidoreductase RnfA subunit